MLIVSVGCPAGIGPEVSVRAAARWMAQSLSKPSEQSAHASPIVLVGELPLLRAAARLVSVDEQRLLPFSGVREALASSSGEIWVHDPGFSLEEKDRQPGLPSARSGEAQLLWVEEAYRLCRELPGAAMVTGPVSKYAIASSGVPGAVKFLGHTEWLEALDGARFSVMCFAAEQLATSLVTTHIPLSEVASAITPEKVALAITSLAELLLALGQARPKIAVCSLNPHAGEGELLGGEERTVILPGIHIAEATLGAQVEVLGPIGAETAFRKANQGAYSGVVAMYHDQATIPMKLVAFGEAVNITAGLSVIRTSVDHGTGYDIAWRGIADAAGMVAAMNMAAALLKRQASADAP